MKVTSSYAVEIKKQRMFDNTIKLYREAVSFLIACFNKEWLAIQSVDKAKAKFNFAEKLVHTTKYNTAKYDFKSTVPAMTSSVWTIPTMQKTKSAAMMLPVSGCSWTTIPCFSLPTPMASGASASNWKVQCRISISFVPE